MVLLLVVAVIFYVPRQMKPKSYMAWLSFQLRNPETKTLSGSFVSTNLSLRFANLQRTLMKWSRRRKGANGKEKRGA